MNIANQMELQAGLEEGLPSSADVCEPGLCVLSSTGMDLIGYLLVFYNSSRVK